MIKNYFTIGFILYVGLSSPMLAKEFRIGLRAIKGKEASLPTAEYLSRNITGHTFKIIPYIKLKQLQIAANANHFDYVITNPSSYVEMEIIAGASRLLTLINKES